jgi:hypothetical protein
LHFSDVALALGDVCSSGAKRTIVQDLAQVRK